MNFNSLTAIPTWNYYACMETPPHSYPEEEYSPHEDPEEEEEDEDDFFPRLCDVISRNEQQTWATGESYLERLEKTLNDFTTSPRLPGTGTSTTGGMSPLALG
jgi:hypothetical protein